jgi:thymidylate synthase
MENIPVLTVRGRSLAETYENALVALHRDGTRFRTQYDKPGDPLSLDSTMNMTVEDPLADPMIHKAFPGGFSDLREYVYELQGLKDGWIKNMNDPDDTRWEYTYHGRLKHYGRWRERVEVDGAARSAFAGPFDIDQIERVIAKLVEQPFTRQAQMITWMPSIDLDCFDPPCLQSLWYRLLADDAGVQWLNCNVRFRSNDAWGANFMNMFGFIQFNEGIIAAGIAERSGRDVRLGRLNWHADSFHIYGKDIADAEARLFNRLAGTTLDQRTFNFHDDAIQEMYHEEEEQILAKIRAMDEKFSRREDA